MKTTVLSALFVLSGLFANAQTPVSLKLNLEKGKVYSVKNTAKQTLKQTFNGQDFKIDITSKSVVSCKVLKQENDLMDLEFRFDTIYTKMSSPMFNKETNSAKPAGNDPKEKILNKVSSYKLIAKISTSGKFIEFVNLPKFRDYVMMTLDSIPAGQKDDAKKVADEMTKESTVKSMIEPLFAYLPDKTVKVGDTWETSYFNVSNMVSLVMLNSYKLQGMENNTATVSGTSEIESMPNNDPSAQMSNELKGTSTSNGTIDLATGLIRESTSTGHIEGTTTVRNNGNETKISLQMDTQAEITMNR